VSAPTALRILVVDHDDSVRGMLGHLFRDEGFGVDEAADGNAALAALRDRAPDCMLLDLVLPDIDGVEVLRTRRDSALAPDTRVVVLTARTDAHDADACRELGADTVLYKPIDPEQLCAAVRAALARTTASP
jgi:DNA-binding response OmpR family regulator